MKNSLTLFLLCLALGAGAATVAPLSSLPQTNVAAAADDLVLNVRSNTSYNTHRIAMTNLSRSIRQLTNVTLESSLSLTHSGMSIWGNTNHSGSYASHEIHITSDGDISLNPAYGGYGGRVQLGPSGYPSRATFQYSYPLGYSQMTEWAAWTPTNGGTGSNIVWIGCRAEAVATNDIRLRWYSPVPVYGGGYFGTTWSGGTLTAEMTTNSWNFPNEISVEGRTLKNYIRNPLPDVALYDDFLYGGTASENIGALRWLVNYSATPTLIGYGGEGISSINLEGVGILFLEPAAALDAWVTLYLKGHYDLRQTNWTSFFVAQTPSIWGRTNAAVKFGFLNNTLTAVATNIDDGGTGSAGSLYVGYSPANENWFYATNGGGTQTTNYFSLAGADNQLVTITFSRTNEANVTCTLDVCNSPYTTHQTETVSLFGVGQATYWKPVIHTRVAQETGYVITQLDSFSYQRIGVHRR